MKKEFKFTNCLHPQQIRNPHTKEVLIVGCGKCEACSLQKSSMRALKCKLESMSHAVTMFVTLTYSNEHVPLMQPIFDIHPDLHEDRKVLFVDDDEIISESRLSLSKLNDLQKKCNLGESLPYLRKRDLQLFMKRLRKHLSKFTDERIRYYAVGEYGPVHFRPHYHLLLWFSERETQEAIEKSIRASWQFGRIDVQVSSGNSSSYVAGYLNSSSHLPRVFKARQARPFSVHSRHLGEEILQSKKEEVYQMSAKDFVTRSITIGDTPTEFSLWRSFKAAYYPKCPKFSTRSSSECYRSYRTYADIREWTQEASPYKQAKIVVDFILTNFGNLQLPILEYFKNEYLINPFIGKTQYEKILRQVYMELRTSEHFLRFVCDGVDSPFHQLQCVRMIESFYGQCDMLNLNQQCIDQDDFLKYDSDEIDDYMYFYNNVFFDSEEYKQKPFFKKFAEKISNKARDSVKHKMLNDQNKVFNY